VRDGVGNAGGSGNGARVKRPAALARVGDDGRGCFYKKYVGGANNVREADVIVMSSGVTNLFYIFY
jgi:hypothetical protein